MAGLTVGVLGFTYLPIYLIESNTESHGVAVRGHSWQSVVCVLLLLFCTSLLALASFGGPEEGRKALNLAKLL